MFNQITFYILLPFLALTQTMEKGHSNNNLEIMGKIQNFEIQPQYIYAYFLDGNKTGLDSFRVVNGKYTIHRIIHTSVMVTLHDRNPEQPGGYKLMNMLVFFTEATKVYVNSDKNLSNAIITGSKANIEYSYLDSLIEKDIKQLPELYKKLSKNERNQQTQFSIDSIDKVIGKVYYTYFLKHPKSLVKTFVLSKYLNRMPSILSEREIMKLRLAYNTLSKFERESFIGKKILKKLNSYDIKIGYSAPNFSQKDTSNNEIKLSTYKGKYVLLDFWASWCAPCRREIPSFLKIYKKKYKQDFEIIGISLDSERDKWLKAIDDDKINWINVSDLQFWNNSVAKLYKVSAIPANFLIDPNGKIIAKNIKPTDLELFLNKE